MKREEIYQIFSNIPTLTTERLTLRRMLVSDAYDMYEYARRELVTRYLSWRPHPNVDYTKEYLQYIGNHYNIGDFFDWGVIHNKDDKFIGTCGFTRFNYNHNSAEIGYVLSPDYWGQGIADEAVREVMKFGFERLGLNRIEAKFIMGNESSKRVMEKTGMTFEGYQRQAMLIKGEYKNIGICSILKDEFKGENK